MNFKSNLGFKAVLSIGAGFLIIMSLGDFVTTNVSGTLIFNADSFAGSFAAFAMVFSYDNV